MKRFMLSVAPSLLCCPCRHALMNPSLAFMDPIDRVYELSSPDALLQHTAH